MKGAARFLFGAALGLVLGYAYILLKQRGVPARRTAAPSLRRPETSRDEEREPAEEIAAS